MAFAFVHLKLVVEPGGAVALAAVLSGRYAAKGQVGRHRTQRRQRRPGGVRPRARGLSLPGGVASMLQHGGGDGGDG